MSRSDELLEKRRRRAEAGVNAILVVLPFFLTAVCIMMLVFSIVYFCDGAKEKKQLEYKTVAEEILSNPGEAWEEWAAMWGVSATTWDELEKPFEKVQQDWESRGLTIDWEYMTNVYNNMRGRKIFDSYKSRLFDEIRNDFAPSYLNPSQTITIAVVLLVLGIIIGTVLIIRWRTTGTFVGMFCS